MVMGGDSCAKCHGFEIRHHILDGHFFTLICCKNCIVCFNRPKINEKRPGLAHFFKKSKKTCSNQAYSNTDHQSRRHSC